MVSFVLLIFFFWILVLFYPAVVMNLVLVGWLMKKWGRSAEDKEAELLRCKQIDLRTDRLKELVFQISIWLILFIAAPFAMYCLYVGLG